MEKSLQFSCRNCGHAEEVEERCIYVNEIVKDTRYVLRVYFILGVHDS